jgi:hypothetical protein
MNKYKFLAWLGAVWSFWSCTEPVQSLSAGFSFIDLVDLLLAGAGLVLCIALIRKKSSALPKARLLLLITAGWSLMSGILVIANPTLRETLSEADSLAWFSWLAGVFIGFQVISNLVMWKLWSSEEAAKYANA